MKQDKPAKPPREFSDWMIVGFVGAIVFFCAVAVFLEKRDAARQADEAVRGTWTDCFDDPAPAQVEAQLRVARKAVDQGDDAAAFVAAQRGRAMLDAARKRRGFKEGLFTDSGIPPPGYEGNAETRLLGGELSYYREQCYPTRLPFWFR